MKKTWMIIACATMLVAACKDKKETTKDATTGTATHLTGDTTVRPPEGKTTTSDGTTSSTGYTIDAPEGWDKTSEPFQGATITYVKSRQENASDDFLENVNVITESMGGSNMDLDEYLNRNVENMETQLTQFHKGDVSDRTINGVKFRVMHYSHVYNDIPIDAIVFFTISNGTAYVITCSAKGGDMGRWEDKFNKIADTFRLT
jgi:hypothetical protein